MLKPPFIIWSRTDHVQQSCGRWCGSKKRLGITLSCSHCFWFVLVMVLCNGKVLKLNRMFPLGPYISFAAAAWNVRPIVQPLSICLPVHYHSSDTSMRCTVARHLAAFRATTVHKLATYYRALPPAPLAPPKGQLFPYPQCHIDLHPPRNPKL